MARKRAGRATLREALEEALVADPDDVATHAASADRLMEVPRLGGLELYAEGPRSRELSALKALLCEGDFE